MAQQDVANACVNSTQQLLTPDSAAARRMTILELWDYTAKVLLRDGKDPPKEKLGALLNLSDRTAKNILWDVIIHSPTHVSSFIDDLIKEALDIANKPMAAEDRNKSARLRSKSRSPRKKVGISTGIHNRAADHLRSMQSLELAAEARAPTAFECLQAFLQIRAGETLEAIAFSDPDDFAVSIPKTLLDRILKPEEAAAHMNSWSLLGGHGNVKSYAMAAWTNQRFIWVTQYDGSTSLHSAPLQPPLFGQPFRCEMPGKS